VPAGLLASVLAHAAADFEIGPELTGSLPIGGRRRHARRSIRRRRGAPPGVRAKTGRIAGALSLAGYAVNRDGHTFAFAVVANQPRGTLDAACHQAMDRLIAEVVGSTDADPDTDPVGPPPG